MMSTEGSTPIPTVTVRGFLNFRTSVDGTVIVFTPSSALPTESSSSSSVYVGDTSTMTTTTTIRPTSTSFFYADASTPLVRATTTIKPSFFFGEFKDENIPTLIKPSTTTPVYFRDESTTSSSEEKEKSSSSSEEKERARVKIRVPGSGPGRFTWNRPVSERVRLNRFKVKVNGQDSLGSNSPASSSTSTRFTARDESDKEAAKLLNRRLNRRLGASRGFHISSRKELDRNKDKPNSNIFEGLLSDASSNEKLDTSSLNEKKHDHELDSEEHTPGNRKVVTEIQTYMSEVTRGFEGGEPIVDTVSLTTTIERTLDPSEAVLFPQALTATPTFIEGSLSTPSLFQGTFEGSFESTPPIVLTKTYTVTESSSRTSLVSATEGASTVTHTITENLIIQKMITGECFLALNILLVLHILNIFIPFPLDFSFNTQIKVK